MQNIRIRLVELRHDGGIKGYHVLAISDPNEDRYMLVSRWGRVHLVGQQKSEEYSSEGGFHSAFEATLKTRKNRGYGVIEDHTIRVANPHKYSFDRFRKEIGLADFGDTGWAASIKCKSVFDRFFDHYDEGGADSDFTLPETEPEIEPDRGELWGSW